MVVGEKMSEIFEGRVEDKQEGALAPDSMLEQGERDRRTGGGRKEQQTGKAKRGRPGKKQGRHAGREWRPLRWPKAG